EARHHILGCDAEQITQVLLNLIMNALQVLPRGGRIEIATREERERLVVEVADDGPGIAPEDRGRVFEPFVFRREGGTGLGLAVVRRILRQHGGDVVADATALGGALFRVWLPFGENRTS
ncbi:MAG: ATP-binding protein, partial [Gammaproteobacteria bacterium]